MNDAQSPTVPTDRPAGNAAQKRPGAHSSNIEVAPLGVLAWKTDAEVQASIGTLYSYAEARAQESIDWYWNAKQSKARWSRFLRLAAIVLAAMGGLAPIIGALDSLSQFSRVVGQVGYIVLGLAAACVGLDKFFGFSSGWMRYVRAALALQDELSAFRLAWAKSSAQARGQAPGPDEIQGAIQQVKDFVQAVDRIVEQETNAWVAEFQTSLTDVERVAAR